MFTELEAAAKFFADPDLYWEKPRFERALMVAQIIGDNSIAAMRTHDMAEDAKENAKRKRK